MKQLDNRLADKWWRLNHLYKIKDKNGNLQTFKPNYVQLKHLAERSAHKRNLILKARQFGFTTLYSIDLLDEALWVHGMTCGIIAHKAQKLPDYFSIVKRAFVNLPDAIRPETKTDTKYMYEFTKRFDGEAMDSSIYVATDIRGGTVQKLHVTESAFIKDRETLNTGSKQAVPLTGWISEETTGNGFNEFYDFYMQWHGKDPETKLDYKTYFYAWVEHPEYTLDGTIEVLTPDEERIRVIAKEQYNIDVTDGQLLWRRWKMKELIQNNKSLGLSADQLFKQEYPLTVIEAFQSGVGSVFTQEKIESIVTKPALTLQTGTNYIKGVDYDTIPQGEREFRDEQVRKYAEICQLGNNLEIYIPPEYGKEYIVGVDPSGGDGSDLGCVDVWQKDTLEQVAQFYGRLRPDELAEMTTKLGYYYNTAYLGVENNMMSTILFVWKSGYPQERIYVHYKEDQITKKRTRAIGWNTNSKTRELIIDEYLVLFEEGNLIINSKHTLSEMRTFVKKDNGKREHAEGKHDDALFAAFIALQMRKHSDPRVRVFANNPLR